MNTLPASRKEAKALGVSKYFDGKTCPHGHISPKYTKSYSCCACHVEHTARHRTKPEAKLTARASYEKRRVGEPERIMWYSAKSRARKLGVPFEITPEDILSVWPVDNICPALGIQMEHNFDAESGCVNMTSPTLDRIKPEGGYVPGNIIVISHRANTIKSDEVAPEVFRRIADWLESLCVKGN